MKIGTQLKTTRLLLGLTQEQFSAGIVTESYYSRVESNKSNISMDSLLKILNYNQVSLYDFFEPIIRENINQELILAFINLDSKKIEQLDLADGNEQMLAKIMLAILKKNNLNNSKDYQMQLEKYLSIKNQGEIQREVIDLLLAYLCDIDQLILIVKKYKKCVFESSEQELILRIIARIELVVMERFYKAGRIDDTRQLVKLLGSLPEDSNIILEKAISRYYLALVNNDDKEAKEVHKILKIIGYDNYLSL